MNHKSIKKFVSEGISSTIEDAARIRRDIEKLLIEDMREQGYVPHLDIDPAFVTNYNAPRDYFEWAVVVHGIYVGRKKAWTIEGVTNGKALTRRVKSEQSSTP